MRASLIILSFTISAALSPSVPARAAAHDHVRNGTFNDGAAEWTAAPATSIAGVTINGDARAMISAAGAPTARVYQRADGALAPGSYSLSMIARADAPLEVTVGVESLADPSLRHAFRERISAEWQRIGGTFALSGAIDARVTIEAIAPGGAALYVDDVRLEGPTPVTFTSTPATTPATTASAPHSATSATVAPPALDATATALATATATPRADVIARTLRNGGFEEATRSAAPFAWETYGGTLMTSSHARSGQLAARVDSATQATKWLHQSVLVEGGASYAFSAWIWHDDPGVAAAFLRVSWYPSDDTSGSALSSADSTQRLEERAQDWRLLNTGSIAAPPGARSARVRVMLAPRGNATASILVDDAAFVSAPPAPPTPAVPTPRAAPAGATNDRAAGAEPPQVRPAPGYAVGTTLAATRPAAPGATRIVINEVLYDASGDGADADGEWVELYNSGDEPIDLAGWSLADAASHDVLPPITVPAHGFAIIAASDSIRTAVADSGATSIAINGRIGNGLGNDGDALYLIDKTGAVADALSWGESHDALDPSVPDVPEGHSIERVTPGAGSGRAADWTDNASPSPGRPYERAAPAVGASPSGRRIEVEHAGAGFGWVPWAAVAGATVALAATVAWRTLDELRTRRPQL